MNRVESKYTGRIISFLFFSISNVAMGKLEDSVESRKL